jgi:hypothetical protein
MLIVQIWCTLHLFVFNGCIGNNAVAQFPFVANTDSCEARLGAYLFEQLAADSLHFPLMRRDADSASRCLVAYIDSIGRALVAAQTDRPENAYISYTFNIITDDSLLDVWTLPGGYMLLSSGIIKMARSEAELVGIMAHQLAHLTNKHGDRAVLRVAQKRALAALIEDPAEVERIVAAKTYLAFNGLEEQAADSCGVNYMVSAGCNPVGIRTFYQLLARDGNPSYEALSTGSSLSARLSYIETVYGQMQMSMGVELQSPKYLGMPMLPNKARADGQNQALNKTVSSSTYEISQWAVAPPEQCVDGDYTTRWGSEFSDNEWVMVDLGGLYTVNKCILRWEYAAAAKYQMLVSSDKTAWQVVANIEDGCYEHRIITFTPTPARWVKMLASARTTPWGYSLFEFEVYSDELSK